MTVILTIENQTHIYDIYGCLQCDDHKALLRVKSCCWDILVKGISPSAFDYAISQLLSYGYLDFRQYPCCLLDQTDRTDNQQENDDDFDRELSLHDDFEIER